MIFWSLPRNLTLWDEKLLAEQIKIEEGVIGEKKGEKKKKGKNKKENWKRENIYFFRNL
jgi:hypothetical protein